MKKLLLLACVLLLGFSNCQKELYDQLENELIGNWYFTKAERRTHDFASFFYSIYSDYQGDQIRFNADKSLVYKESGATELNGIWDVHLVETTDSDNNTMTQYIVTIAYEDLSGNLIQYVWETERCLYGHLIADENTSDYIFRFELQKL